MYVLNLAKDNRILSVWVMMEGQNYDDMPIVNKFPDGDVTDYKYVDGEYVYDPLPEPEPIEPEPTADELLNAISRGLGYE